VRKRGRKRDREREIEKEREKEIERKRERERKRECFAVYNSKSFVLYWGQEAEGLTSAFYG
jgi:hypothetical protein